MTLQRFRPNDQDEAKIIAAADPALVALGEDLDAFFEGAFTAFPLGNVLYDLDRDPLASVITRSTYSTSFFALHDLFTRPGTFEFYLDLFRSIWGETADIQFEVPGPGRLNINISEVDLAEFRLQFRQIIDNEYVYFDAKTSDGDQIIVTDLVGTKKQSEVDALIREISPAGVHVVATLVL